jgi:hypothetical protein
LFKGKPLFYQFHYDWYSQQPIRTVSQGGKSPVRKNTLSSNSSKLDNLVNDDETKLASPTGSIKSPFRRRRKSAAGTPKSPDKKVLDLTSDDAFSFG